MINNATSKRIYMNTCGPKKNPFFFCISRTHSPTVYKDPAQGLALALHVFFPKALCVSWVVWAPVSSPRSACVRVAPALAGLAAQRSMRLNKHGMAAGAHSQGWGQEEGMRLGGNKSKFLWNDLTGNDRVSALYNHTARERERAGEVLPKHRVVPDLSRWGWWNNKAFPVCVFH